MKDMLLSLVGVDKQCTLVGERIIAAWRQPEEPLERV